MRHKSLIPLAAIALLLLPGVMQWVMTSTSAQRRSPTRRQPAPGQTATPKKGTPLDQQPDVPLDPVLVPLYGCCGKKPPLKQIPNYSSSTYASFTGRIAVATMRGDYPTSPSVVIWDLKNQANAPVGTDWNSAVSSPTDYYFHPDWTKGKIGDVFGLTLDGSGNIYAATSRVHGTTVMGSSTVLPGSPGRGDIYKIDGNTGAVTRFVQTGNSQTYQTGSPNKIPNTGPGIGNIHYSCDYNNFYVTNFEDGVIYRIDAGGNILSRWDHGQNLPNATPAAPAINDTDVIANNPGAPFTQLGRRPWAVQVFDGRLYYSIWWEHGSGSGGAFPGNVANEIWSIGLTAAGDFTGSARREIVVGHLNPVNWDFSNPVSDISFSDTGKMLLAERTMGSDTATGTNFSRLLEYVWNGSAWVQPVPNKYSIGQYGGFGSAAGGCDYDNGPGGRVWVTGNALGTSTPISGLQGTPAAGGSFSNSILIDVDDDVVQGDKARAGDVEIPCFQCDLIPPAPQINAPDYTCAAPGQYCVAAPVAGVTYTWSVTGGTPTPATGSCTTIAWNNSTTNKVIVVTATGGDGCSSVSKMKLNECNLQLGSCCAAANANAVYKSLVHTGGGLYNFTSTLTTSTPGITRVTANILSASLTYSPATCGTNGPVNSYIPSALPPVPGFTASLPVPNGDEVIWYNGTGVGVGGVDFPFQIKFPPPPGGFFCRDYLSFCVKYTFTNSGCTTCEVIRCYGPIQRGGPIIKNGGTDVNIKSKN